MKYSHSKVDNLECFMDKLTHFKTFIAIVEKGNLKNAADYLNLTPSAVSKHLSSLEGIYKADLIIRDSKKIRITHQGSCFYKKCKKVIDSLLEAEAILQTTHTLSPCTLNITLSQVLAQSPLMKALKLFSQKYPHIKLQILVSNKNLDLLKDSIDFAFRGGKLADSQVKYLPITHANLRLAASPEFDMANHTRDPIQLIKDSLIIPSYINLSELRGYLAKIGIRQALELFSACDDAFAYKNAIVEGMGIGVFLDFFIQDEINQNRLVILNSPYSFNYNQLNINMLFHKNVSLPPHHALFKDFIEQHFKQNPWHTI